MSITLRNDTVPPGSAPEDDPFRYGWRYVKHERPDGSMEYEQLPLTLEDVLHPQVEDFIVHTTEHDNGIHYLKGVTRAQVKHDSGAVVLSNTRIAWDRGGVLPMGPDLALIFGVKTIKNWATFHCTEDGVRPVLVIEVTSPETGFLDVDDRVVLYERAEIPWYIIVDYDTGRLKPPYARNWTPPPPTVFGYHLGPTGYERIVPNERGWIWMDPLSLWIGIEDGHVQCYDGGGTPIGDYVAVVAALEASERAREEIQSSLDQERAARLAADDARAAAETARLEAEKRLEALEARLREIEQTSGDSDGDR